MDMDSNVDLEIGAENISTRVFGGKLTARQVYRLAEKPGLGFFKLQNKVACIPSKLREELRRRASCGEGRPDDSA